MAKKKSKKIKNKYRKVLVAISIVLVVAFVVVCYFKPDFYDKIVGLITPKNYSSYVEPTEVEVSSINDAKIHFIDVGQADCIFMELPDGYTVLIDSGDNSSTYNERMVNYIKDLHYNHIDLLIATHTDLDHIGGMVDIFDNFEVRKVYRPAVKYSGSHYEFNSDYNSATSTKVCSTKTYGKFLDKILKEEFTFEDKLAKCSWKFFNKDTDIERKVIYNDNSYTYKFDFLTPVASVENIHYNNLNDFSPIIKFEFNNYSILFTGDAEKEVEEELLLNYSATSLDVDLLKVGHHGSNSSSTQEFINAVRPEYAVIMCGEGNKYEHPHKVTLDKFKAYGMSNNFNLFRTDNNGNIVVTIKSILQSEGNFTVTCEKTSTDNFISPQQVA